MPLMKPTGVHSPHPSRVSRPPASQSLWFATGTACILASFCTYFGVGISAIVVSANGDGPAVLSLVAYLLLGIVGPLWVYWHESRNKERSLASILLRAAGLSVIVNLVLAPVGIAVLSGA